jgi:hypothetical protein
MFKKNKKINKIKKKVILMKSILMILSIGALIIGIFLTVGLLIEKDKPQPAIIYYDVPAPMPTQAQYERVVAAPVGISGHAVIKVNPIGEVN